ncbi:hypothetical protein Tco_1041776 [Tanacetum coccineum]|uniref:Uncharacterized protein n=1 Tax=Tanacetum coccineum TaxID=301880 RepID=A0ABQ5GHN0_9ASTR
MLWSSRAYDLRLELAIRAHLRGIAQIHKRAASLQSKPLPYSDLCKIVFQSISANGDGQWTNTEFGASASVYGASASEASASRASAIRERGLSTYYGHDPLRLCLNVVVDERL